MQFSEIKGTDMVVKIAIWSVRSYDSKILQGFSVPEYGRNRFWVVAGEIVVETRKIVRNRELFRFCLKPENSGRVTTRKVKRDPVQDPDLEDSFFFFFSPFFSLFP
jgi:hypothetical protein